MELYTYIKKCIADFYKITNNNKKNVKKIKTRPYFNDGIQLYEAIINLMEVLQKRSKKVISTNNNKKSVKPSFFSMYEDESEMDNKKKI